MKKTFLMLMGIVCTLLASAQDTWKLTEEESQKLVESQEYKAVLQGKFALVETVYAAIQRGVRPEALQESFNAGVKTGDYSVLLVQLFGSAKAGTSFLSDLDARQVTFLKSNTTLEKSKDQLTCKTCTPSLEDQFAYFLKNVEGLHTLLSGIVQKSGASAPTCGSWANQLKVLACGALCAGTTGQLIACGWGCWCEFCHDNSVLAGWICN